MYYLATAVLRPVLLAYVAVALALIILWRQRERRRRLIVLTTAFLLLVVLSLPVTKYFSLGSLEWPFPPLDSPPPDAPAIVVLSGSIRPASTDNSRFEPGTDSLYRCLRAAEVYRLSPCPVLVSGGKVHDSDPGPPIARVLRDLLITLGVKAEDLIVEDVSRTTYENAIESARLLEKRDIHRVILVSDAAHLRRAVGCFRKQGMEVIPCGCRYRALPAPSGIGDFLPDPSAAVGVEEAAHEWLGLAWYWLTDKL
jgi:uncharacterized SAM-binding protein YcdF (DUF218 family)